MARRARCVAGGRRPQQGGILLWLLFLLLLALVGGAVYAVREPLLEALADWWVVDDRLEKAQAIIVLGGDDMRGSRVREAADLYQAGWAPRLVLSGAPLRSYFNETDLMERDALNWGVPKQHLILARHNAASTLEEAWALRSTLTEHNFRKVIVVTSNFHTRRARRIFRQLYQQQGVQVLMHPAPDVNFNPSNWWRQREARAAFLLEVVKSLNTLWELRRLPATPTPELSPAEL